jgi:hypothetical protein
LRKERIGSVGASCHVEFCRWPALSAPRGSINLFYDSTGGGSSALMEASVEMGACHSPPQPQCHTTTTSAATHSHHAWATCVQGVPSSPGVLLLSVPSGLQRWWLALKQRGSTGSGEDQGQCYNFFFLIWGHLQYLLEPALQPVSSMKTERLDKRCDFRLVYQYIFSHGTSPVSCEVSLFFSPLIPNIVCCQTFIPLLLMINIKVR